MKVYLTEMHSIRDAIRTMYMSKRSWTPEREKYISDLVEECTDLYGRPKKDIDHFYKEKFDEECRKLFKWGQHHITMLRFLDISVVVEGLHRGACDDLDAHAKRMDNRIIRSSTRLANYKSNEISEWYQDKVLTLEEVLKGLEVELPETFEKDGVTYVKAENGYIKSGLENNKDVKRGLYMLSLPMTFTFKCNITELAHIYRERGTKEGGAHGTAAPELQDMMELLMDQIHEWYPQITREYLLGILN